MSVSNHTNTPTKRVNGSSPSRTKNKLLVDKIVRPCTPATLTPINALETSRVGQLRWLSLLRRVIFLQLVDSNDLPKKGILIKTKPNLAIVNQNPLAPFHTHGTSPTRAQAPSSRASPHILKMKFLNILSRTFRQGFNIANKRPRRQKKICADVLLQYQNSYLFCKESKLQGSPLSWISMAAKLTINETASTPSPANMFRYPKLIVSIPIEIPTIQLLGKKPSQGQFPPTISSQFTQSHQSRLYVYQRGAFYNFSDFIDIKKSKLKRYIKKRQESLVLGLLRCRPDKKRRQSGRQNASIDMKEAREGNIEETCCRLSAKWF